MTTTPQAPSGAKCNDTNMANHRHSGGKPAGEWSKADRLRGWRMDGGTKVYCCYGMYCDVGHSGGCEFSAAPAPAPAGEGGA